MTHPEGSYGMAEAGQALQDFVEKAGERYPTGYSIDATCGKIGPGELAMLCARASIGKSNYVLNVVANSPEIPTVFVSLEMPAHTLCQWLVCIANELETPQDQIEDVLRAGPDHDGFPELRTALRVLPERFPHFEIWEPARAPTVLELIRYVDDLEDATGIQPKRLFIDHLGLMPGAQDTEGLKAVTSALKGWAKRDGVAVHCLQQASRAGGEVSRNDGHLPLTLSSGMYGGEHDADWIFGLYRPEKSPEFRKQRHEFKKPDDYLRMTVEREKVRNLTRLQVIKNRIFGKTKDMGIDLFYDPVSRRLTEYGGDE